MAFISARGPGASAQEARMRKALKIAVVVAGIILVAVKVLISTKMLLDINLLQSRGSVAYATTNKMVQSLHISLPNNLQNFPVEQLVPLP